jgi:predicted nucleic acid-binding protein
LSPTALVDAGPLYAFLDPQDANHRLAVETVRDLPLPLLTVESALSELTFLLRRRGKDMNYALQLVSEGMLAVMPMFPDEGPRIQELMQRYANVPMSLADACLVRLSELMPQATLFTFDRDFLVYRRHRAEALPLVAAPLRVQEPAVAYAVPSFPSTESP